MANRYYQVKIKIIDYSKKKKKSIQDFKLIDK